jgi:hypothetical protein
MFTKTKITLLRKVLFAAGAVTMFVAVSPASAASPTDDAEWDRSVYPPVGSCHFVTERTLTQKGGVIYERHQVCN